MTPEVFVHDADGNLLSDGRWTYTWDAENRLVGMETRAAAVLAGAPKQKLEFAYDSQSRRFRKTVWRDYGSGWELQDDRLFIYDGWNLIMELAEGQRGLEIERSFTWGLDLSETLQGAGGVGGLLAMQDVDSGLTLLPFYDGNGNVVGLFDTATETVVGEYEYSPFGEVLRATGVTATFGFSTKFTDVETGLLYYGYRFYHPEKGRWLSRDPIGEEGGVNLYGFVSNIPISEVDELGLALVKHPGAQTLFLQNKPADFFKGSSAVGRTTHVWPNPVAVMQGRKVVITGELQVEIHISINYPYNKIGADGLTVSKHERIHAGHFIDSWNNKLADFANKLEGEYCSRKCARYAASMVNSYSQYIYNQAYATTLHFDVTSYGRKGIDKDINRLKALSKAHYNKYTEVKRQWIAANCTFPQ